MTHSNKPATSSKTTLTSSETSSTGSKMTPTSTLSSSKTTKDPALTTEKSSTRAPVIGVFDSGVGGLTIARAIVEKMPSVTLRYFADSVHLPYGNKSRKNIVTYTLESVKFLEDQGIDFLVVACNTASAVALPALKERFPHLKMTGVIHPGAKRAQAETKTKHIAIIGTLRTIASNAYRDELLLLDPTLSIHQKACPLLVPLVEEGWKNPLVLHTVLHEYLDPFIASVDVLVLGCTHYPLIQHEIHALFPHLEIIDSPAAVVHEMEEHGWLHSSPVRNAITTSAELSSHGSSSPAITSTTPITLTTSRTPIKLETSTKLMKSTAQSTNPITFYTNDLNETLVHLAHQFFVKPDIVLV